MLFRSRARSRRPAAITRALLPPRHRPIERQSRWAFLTTIDASFVVGLTVALLLVALVPTLYGYLASPPGKVFSGFAGNVHDAAQYMSWMRESGSHMLIDNRLTSEPNPRVFINLHWWIPGRFAQLLGLDIMKAYHLFHGLSIVLYTVTAYAVLRVFQQDRNRLRLSLVLATFSSGLGWVWVADKYLNRRSDMLFPTDVYVTQTNSLQLATITPHQLLALALTLAVLALAWLGFSRKSWYLTLAASGLALFLGMGHVYDLVTVWSILALFGLVITVRHGFSLDTFLRLAPIVLVSAPAAIYFGWIASSANPLWSRAFAQYDYLGVHTPSPPHLIILLGLLLPLAVTGMLHGLRSPRHVSHRTLFLSTWFIVHLGIAYLPVRFEIMLLTGVQVVMAVLAADAVYGVIMPWVGRVAHQVRSGRVSMLVKFIPILVVVLLIPTNVYLVLWRINELSRPDYPFFLEQSDVAALQWLGEDANADSVVLSSLSIGHFIPGMTGKRAFLANAVMTIDFFSKREVVQRYFAGETNETSRAKVLRDYGIDYVFFGNAERLVGPYDPSLSPVLQPVFIGHSTTIFKVDRRLLALNDGESANH